MRVNLILFELSETQQPLLRTDPRAVHLLDVLRRKVGDSFDAGLVNGPRGKGTLVRLAGTALTLSFIWGPEPPPLDPITLIVGLPRPQTARKILQEATSLGIAQLHFVSTEKGEPNYGASVLWQSGEWRRHVWHGAEQAFCTRLPAISYDKTLPQILATLPDTGTRFALDNYTSAQSLADLSSGPGDCTLAVGPERGWSETERVLLRSKNFSFAHLGPRVLRVETACVAALAVLKAQARRW